MNAKRRLVSEILFFAALFAGCTTTTTENGNYNITDAKPDSILDSKLRKLEEDTVKYPLRADLHYEIASLHAKKGECRESAKALERAIQLAPEEAKYHFHLGRVLLSMSDLSAAEKEFRAAARLSREGRYTGPQAALGWTLSLKKDVDGAIAEFGKCIEVDPGNPVFYFFLGSLHDMKGEREPAIHNFREYLARGGVTYRKKTSDILRSLGVETADIPEAQDSGRSEDLFGQGIEGPRK